MTDEEKLLDAGWSPNSLRLALDDFDSPLASKRESGVIVGISSTHDRMALKRSPIVRFGTPKSSDHQKTKVADLKKTPRPCSQGYTIDLSVSTTKKAVEDKANSLLYCSDDDITILTKSFRRQSIERGRMIKTVEDRKKTSISSTIDGHNGKPYSLEFNLPHSLSPNRENTSNMAISNKENTYIDNFTSITKDHTAALRNNQMKGCSQPFDNGYKFNSKNSSENKFSPSSDFNLRLDKSSRSILVKEFKSAINIEAICKIEDINKLRVQEKIEQLEISAEVDKIQNVVPPESQIEKMISAADLDNVLPNGWKLFQHQKDAVIDCIKLGRSIMAFDMGLGKTLISLIWAKSVCSSFSDCITIIIVPCTLIQIWKREAEMLGFHVIQNLPKNNQNYECSNNNENHKKIKFKPQISINSWAKIPMQTEINTKYVLIADEAHAMQSITSIRTKNILSLCLHKYCYGVILSTGTPMKNGRPSNILPLLIGIRHPVASNKIEFEKKYCNAKKTKFCVWDTSGASNLEELRTAIGPYLLRKTKVGSQMFSISLIQIWEGFDLLF